MKTTEVVDASTGEISVVEQTPVEFLGDAQQKAKVLMDVVEAQKLYSDIQGKRYLRLEAWQFLAGLSHHTPRTREITEIFEEGKPVGVRVYVELLRDADCAIVGGAYGRCDYNERISRSGKFACESMAQTRATSKAISQKLRYVPVLAGYAGTPAEEMTGVEERVETPKAPRAPKTPKWKMNPDADLAPSHPAWDTAGAPEKVSEAAPGDAADGFRRGASKGAALPAPAVHWLNDVMPAINSRPNWSGKTWKWLCEGKVGGDRHAFVQTVLAHPEASDALKERCNYALRQMEGG